MLMLTGLEKIEGLQKKHISIGKGVLGLLEGIEMYIKRTLYTSNKKKELEESKDKITQMKEMEETIKFTLNIFESVNQNLEKSQYQTAVLLYKFVDEKNIPEKLNIQEFTEIYSALKDQVIVKLTQ